MLRSFFFFFNDTATTEIYTLSLHDALPILSRHHGRAVRRENANRRLLQLRPLALRVGRGRLAVASGAEISDRKSTRLNSSHDQISYAVFCLKKKKTADERRATDPRDTSRRT